MFPWLWFWAPTLHLPFSGAVAQRIDPDTNWFFRVIDPRAGDADVEQQAFNVASYGRQLGLITEVLIDLAQQVGTQSPQAGESLARLEAIRGRIEAIKSDAAAAEVEQVTTQVRALQRKAGAPYAELVRQLQPLLGLPSA
mgnify:CR=1 FL=1